MRILLVLLFVSGCTSSGGQPKPRRVPAFPQSMPMEPRSVEVEPDQPPHADFSPTLAEVIFQQVRETCMRRFECKDGFPPPPAANYIEECAREETKNVCAHLDCSVRIPIDFDGAEWQACLSGMRSASCSQVQKAPDTCDLPEQEEGDIIWTDI